MDKAFDPFFTTKQAGHGTGLGLSQVYGFIRQSGGHVRIYSEPGIGTTVKLYLPRLQTSAAQHVVAQSSAVPAGSIKGSILVVEDDADVRAFATQAIAELGYRVLEAGDAHSALAVLEREAGVDLLFTDVGLPNGVNGRQLAYEARRRQPALKVLYATATHAVRSFIMAGSIPEWNCSTSRSRKRTWRRGFGDCSIPELSRVLRRRGRRP